VIKITNYLLTYKVMCLKYSVVVMSLKT